MSDLVTREVVGDVFLIGLNRADKRNAANVALLEELSLAFGEYEKNDQLRCAVLHAHGDHFCAGLEVTDCAEPLMAPTSKGFVPEGGIDPWGITTPRCSKPVIVAAKGYCMTIAIEICLAADIVVAADDAKFAQLEISRGLFPFGGATIRWPLASGYQNAMRYLLTGDMFGAEEAKRLGMVQDIVPADQVLDHAVSLAKKIAAHAPLGVKATLRTARQMQDHGHAVGVAALYPEIRTIYHTEDAKVGIETFLDKQRPIYKGQ